MKNIAYYNLREQIIRYVGDNMPPGELVDYFGEDAKNVKYDQITKWLLENYSSNKKFREVLRVFIEMTHPEVVATAITKTYVLEVPELGLSTTIQEFEDLNLGEGEQEISYVEVDDNEMEIESSEESEAIIDLFNLVKHGT